MTMENEILDKLAGMGVDKTEIKLSDLHNLLQGKLSDMMNFTVPDNKAVRDFLDKAKVDYSIENDKIKFSGKVKSETVYEADDNERNRNILNENKISYETIPEKNRLRWVASNAAILAIYAINPIIGIVAFSYNTLRLIAKKIQIENTYNLANPELQRLKKGEIIQSSDRFGNAVIRQLDKDTNTIMSVRTDSIQIPHKIYDTNLSERQKQLLRNGMAIEIKDDRGKKINVRLDLVNGTGLTTIGGIHKNKAIEKENIGFKL